MSPAKSEAIWFYNNRRRGSPPPDLCLDRSGEEVEVRPHMKYIDLIIDSQWTFGSHFKLLVPKVTTTANALCGLLQNIGGTEVGVRRLKKKENGARKTWSIRGIPIENRKVDDEHLSALRRVRGHGPPHAVVLSGVGGPPSYSVTSVLREIRRRPHSLTTLTTLKTPQLSHGYILYPGSGIPSTPMPHGQVNEEHNAHRIVDISVTETEIR
ncbi:uncharacterized protein LOC117240617 [Bombus vosnesenskii]|uniref:Uncharacterized protein LOC117240617 n=1 Tax=Bombus vosnesenskii TaxID=207650 RepID=A0A6J3LF53_9HYME|nr:uncharacterized protein LOC117240617 [Bombus vosnesenskii]